MLRVGRPGIRASDATAERERALREALDAWPEWNPVKAAARSKTAGIAAVSALEQGTPGLG